jgi:hypothetical protein
MERLRKVIEVLYGPAVLLRRGDERGGGESTFSASGIFHVYVQGVEITVRGTRRVAQSTETLMIERVPAG